MYNQQWEILMAILTNFFSSVKMIFILLSPIDYFVFQNEQN